MNEAAKNAPDPGELEKTGGQLSDADQNSVDTTGNEDPKPNRDRRSERRINRLTARNAGLAEDNEKLRTRLDSLESKVDAIPAQKPVRPQRENFESEEDYEDAYFDYRQDKIKPAKVEKPSPQVNTEVAQRSHDYIAEMDKASEGFAKVVQDAKFPLTEHSWNELMGMGEDGADVFVHLNGNPQEAMRISQLSPREQTIELEKLTDTLDKSSAPEPIKPVDGNDKPQVDESKLSTAEWIARRNRKVHGR